MAAAEDWRCCLHVAFVFVFWKAGDSHAHAFCFSPEHFEAKWFRWWGISHFDTCWVVVTASKLIEFNIYLGLLCLSFNYIESIWEIWFIVLKVLGFCYYMFVVDWIYLIVYVCLELIFVGWEIVWWKLDYVLRLVIATSLERETEEDREVMQSWKKWSVWSKTAEFWLYANQRFWS